MRRILAFMLITSACSPSTETTTASASSSSGECSCYADAGPPDAGRSLPENPTLDQLETAWGDVECHVFACIRHTRETPEMCARARTAPGWPFDVFRRARASITSGRGTLNQDAANACGAILLSIDPSAQCFGSSVQTFAQRFGEDFRASCGNLVTGTVPKDGTCDSTSECAGEGECIFSRTMDCSGQCMWWIHADQSCVDHYNDCGPERFCDGTICKWKNLANNGTQCFDDGESCKSGKCFDYQCKDTSAENGECLAEGDCDEGLFCRPLPPSTGHLGVCQRPAQSGEMCGYTVQCAGNQACKGYFNHPQGGWTPGECSSSPVGIGASCTPIADMYEFGDTGCFMDLVCNPTTSKCEEGPAIGAACIGGHCGLDAYCDDANTCQLRKAHGQSATSSPECLQYFNMFEMKCEDPAIRDRCFMQ